MKLHLLIQITAIKNIVEYTIVLKIEVIREDVVIV